MSYRTTCPHCASVFRLGANQLEAAQGWAQCGVCGAAFDARPSLLAEDGSPLPPAPVMAEATGAEPVQAPTTPLPADEAAPSPLVPDVAGEPNASGTTDEPVATEPPIEKVQREALDLPSIISIDTKILLSADHGHLPPIYPSPSYPKTPASVSPPRPVAAPPPPVTPPPAKKRTEHTAPKLGKARVPFARHRRIAPWAWGMASALLLVLLFGQAACFLRDTLVSRLPQTRPAFEQACALLGCSLSPPKNLALLEIIGSDLQTEANGRLTLILTLGNRATHAQAWPILVLTLTDQRSRPLARRSFAPSEYLDNPQRIAAGIPPHSEQALNLPLTVHDLAPMGFDLQLTY